MAAPVLVPTSQATLQLASSWRLLVDTAYDQTLVTPATPVWSVVYDLVDFSPGAPEFAKVDTTTYDSADPTTGLVSTSQRKVSQTQVLSGSRLRNVYAAPEDNAGWQEIRDASKNNKLVHVLWFNTDPSGEAFHGYADPSYAPQGGGPADRGVDQITLELQGNRQAIANPMAAAVLPNATTATPTTGPAGTSVVITGTGFVGITPTSGVKFGSTNAALFTVDSPTQITAVVPTGGAAGPQNILVTNTVGADTTPVTFTKS